VTPLILLGAAIVLLLVLIVRVKLNPFLALTLTSFFLGLANGMAPQAALNSVVKGAGDTLGSIVFIIVSGAAIGKLIEESGAAMAVSRAFTRFFGLHRIQIPWCSPASSWDCRCFTTPASWCSRRWFMRFPPPLV